MTIFTMEINYGNTNKERPMAWIAKDNDGQEVLFASCPRFNEAEGAWIADDGKVVEVSRVFEMLGLEWHGKPIEI